MSTLKTNAIQTVAGKPILNSTGSILQVVTNKIPTSYNLTSATEVAIYNPLITITPTTTTSLIFFDIQFFGYHNPANDFYTSLWVRRNAIGSGNAISSSQAGTWGDWSRNFASMVATSAHADYHFSGWDLPGTTSSTTYILSGLNHTASRSFILWHDIPANARQLQITAFEVSR